MVSVTRNPFMEVNNVQVTCLTVEPVPQLAKREIDQEYGQAGHTAPALGHRRGNKDMIA